MITPEKLQLILPKSVDPKLWSTALSKYLPKYGINTKNREAAFLAQALHESTYFSRLKENLNYSADRLNVVFPKYFIKAGRNAAEYARNPEKIANIVYANRLGNGDTASGDGFKYRGRGIFQLTGKENYTAFGKTINKTPEQVVAYLETVDGAVESACWYWSTRKLNALADKSSIDAISKAINGGTIGLEERRVIYNKLLGIL